MNKVRIRFHGSDIDFCAWLREQDAELPSYSEQCGWVASDVDLVVHRYKADVAERFGTRDIQAIMDLEVKTRNGKPHPSQRDTLFKKHAFRGEKFVNSVCVQYLGVYFLRMNNTRPDNSKALFWGAFASDTSQEIEWTSITLPIMFEVLRFERHPETLERHFYRRDPDTGVIKRTPLTDSALQSPASEMWRW